MYYKEKDWNDYSIIGRGNRLIQKINGIVFSELTDEQVVAIYVDRIANWKEVGGADASIAVVHKAAGRSIRSLAKLARKIESARQEGDEIIMPEWTDEDDRALAEALRARS